MSEAEQRAADKRWAAEETADHFQRENMELRVKCERQRKLVEKMLSDQRRLENRLDGALAEKEAWEKAAKREESRARLWEVKEETARHFAWVWCGVAFIEFGVWMMAWGFWR